MKNDRDQHNNYKIIESVSDYIQCVSELTNASDNSSKQFFFRGQANKHWILEPSVFRNNLLAKESELIEYAYRRAPFEFEGRNDFDTLTKLQHYGLPTRLLDVTLNPLVALYFACEVSVDAKMSDQNIDVDDTVEQHSDEIDGVIYYKNCYAETYRSKEVEIVAKLATTDTSKGFSLTDYLDVAGKMVMPQYCHMGADLPKDNIYLKYKKDIDIIQSNYFVVSSSNNDRLIRQSGAFLLASCFRVNVNSDEANTIVAKNRGSLRGEFEDNVFIIPACKKREILNELDYYNINKGTLFPELEHQMAYIKTLIEHETSSLSVGTFEKASEYKPMDIEPEIIDFKSLETEVGKIISHCELKNDEPKYIAEIIKKNISVIDWHKKESVVSECRLEIKRYLLSAKYNNELATKYSEDIVNRLKELYLWAEGECVVLEYD